MDKVEVVQEGNAGEQLLRKLLDVRARERDKAVRLEEVEHALPVKVGDNADVVSEVEAVS
jgi:DNA-binding TFAR19-related protein (PDSD5 family)